MSPRIKNQISALRNGGGGGVLPGPFPRSTSAVSLISAADVV